GPMSGRCTRLPESSHISSILVPRKTVPFQSRLQPPAHSAYYPPTIRRKIGYTYITMPATENPTLHRIKTILRRDLKLGPGADIPDDMPFFGGDFDLDSLDVLLLMTSIEKEFGFKIPSEQIGKEVFKNVATLAAYIEKAVRDRPPAPAGDAPAEDYLARLPHADPFRFVSRVISLQPGTEGEGIWSIDGTEEFFKGHFPNNPIVPGVLIAEALAQFAGIVGASARDARHGKLAHVDIRFDQSVSPPVDISLHARTRTSMGHLQHFEVSATANKQTIARGTLTLTLPRE
ncbi:MAG TPA: phosphopantetheine-binding protein, partial [Tepidisphaeraceae bacterium]